LAREGRAVTRYTIRLAVTADPPMTTWAAEADVQAISTRAPGFRWCDWTRPARRIEHAEFRVTVRVRCDDLSAAHEAAGEILVLAAEHPSGATCALLNVDTTLPRRR
jgi:hypothetical protein